MLEPEEETNVPASPESDILPIMEEDDDDEFEDDDIIEDDEEEVT